MKSYHSIPYPTDEYGRKCIAFCKKDGSNLRFEWNPKKGWYKFGTRNRLFDLKDPDYGCAVDLFLGKYGEPVAKILVDSLKVKESAIAFAEFFGPHSFAGQHDPIRLGVENNSPKDLVLFDVNVHKKGMLGPEEFLKTFGLLDVAEVVYRGKFTQQFQQEVIDGKYDVKEGIIAKYGERHDLWMVKVKTAAYKQKLVEFFGQDWQKHW